ncbi:MAG: DEAD/DEAH box helicase [Gemmatimonadota bacterium]|nr:MAG: DEAD/DEAH box helicase [Gemmatimonadota bacterium]
MNTSFASFGLAPELLRGLDEKGYIEPTPIQREAIPAGLAGRDVVGAAQTGTGKTAAFLLPILQRLKHGRQGTLRALVLVPTRELADQVFHSALSYGKYSRLEAVAVYGGVSLEKQTRALKDRVDIVIATPGRLLDHMGRGHIDCSDIEVLVLDEADRMLDMGFSHDVNRILGVLPIEHQTLLFSATISDQVDRLARRALKDHAAVEVGGRAAAAKGVEHLLVAVDRLQKRHALVRLLGELPERGRALVFTRTKHGADRLTRQLRSDGVRVAALHGGKAQSLRTRALDGFREGRIRTLVATDVAARGIHIDDVVMVVNYDVPVDPEIYVHRVGRTARAGAQGVALTLMSPDEWLLMYDVEKLMGMTFHRDVMPGLEPAVAPLQPLGRHAPARRSGPSLRPRRGGARRR